MQCNKQWKTKKFYQNLCTLIIYLNFLNKNQILKFQCRHGGLVKEREAKSNHKNAVVFVRKAQLCLSIFFLFKNNLKPVANTNMYRNALEKGSEAHRANSKECTGTGFGNFGFNFEKETHSHTHIIKISFEKEPKDV